MIKSSSSDINPCGNGTTSECVTWQGDDIECLGIEKGQLLSVTVKNVADEVCTLMDDLDLSDLDLKCVFDICISCPEPEKTVRSVFELLINKVCDIDEIVDTLSTATSTGSDPIILMASCFQFTDVDGDLITSLPHSTYTKRIANQVCQILLDLSSLQDDVQNLENTVNDLQEQINDLDTSIPDVTSDCLFVGTKSIDDAWDLLDQAFCQLRTSVGLPTDINIAISRQSNCEDINATLNTEEGWQNNPANAAESLANLWIAFCNVWGRVTTIEDNCCKVGCSDVTVGFAVALNQERNEATIRFTSGAGTSIPDGFEDGGSTLTVTDQSGNSEDFDIEITQGGEEVITFSSLNTNDDYDFALNAILSDGSVTCEKCYNKKVTFQSTCSFCTISVTGSTGTVTIIYDDGGTFIATSFDPTTSTTTTSTTTTTTLA